MSPKKIMFVINSLGRGGAEIQLLYLTQALLEKGWDVHIVSGVGGALEDRFAELNVTVTNLRARKVTAPLALLRLAVLIRSWKPSVVHSHLLHANVLCRLTRILAPVPVVITTVHSTVEGGMLVTGLYRLTDRLADLTSNVSQGSVDHYIQTGAVPQDRIIVMHNGLNVQRFVAKAEAREPVRERLGLDETQFAWIAVGRFQREKDYPNMMAALHRLVAKHPNTKLLLVGYGSLEEQVKADIERYRLQDVVMMLGERSDVPSLMAAADGYLMSSVIEGLPMVLLEAAAMKLPIVCTDVGGNGDIVSDGVSGVVVPTQDAQALAEGAANVQELAVSMRQEWGQQGHRIVMERFAMSAVARQWAELYEARITEAGGRRRWGR